MAKAHAPLLAFNRGEVSKFALARVDLERLRLAAECQVNWAPSAQGAMRLRSGTRYLGSTKSDAQAKLLPFIFSSDDTAILELTNSVLRVWKNDALITRPAVSTVVTNGDFSSATGWTLTASSGADAAISAGLLALHANAIGSTAFCERQVTVAGGDQGVVHALRIVVLAASGGPVTFQIGSTSGGTDYLAQTDLESGTHSIAFTPTGNFYVRFSTASPTTKQVDSITVEAAGVLELPTPWATADLAKVRGAQSGDINYIGCEGYQPRRIERRDNDSWSVVLYRTTGGPFRLKPAWANDITISASAQFGSVTLTASRAFWKSTHAGMLVRLPSGGQDMARNIAGAGQFTEAIRVRGIGASNDYSFTLAGTWSGTISRQVSYDSAETNFNTVETDTINGANPVTLGTDHDNIIHWARWGFEPGNYTSGTAELTVDYNQLGEAGIARIADVISATQVSANMIKPLFDDDVTNDWELGEWSDADGWPTAVEFHDGRLFWAGNDRIWGSVSDGYSNFDDTVEGDSGPIQRSIGSGPVAKVNWLISLARLVVGCKDREVSIRASSLDEPLTPTSFTSKTCSTQGSTTGLPAVKIDTRGVFVEKSGRRVYELLFNVELNDYGSRDLTRLNSDIGVPGFVAIAAQRQPDTHVHLVRGDGQTAMLLKAPEEEIEAWWRIMTLGVVEDCVVLPGDLEDARYYVIKRTINGQTKRYLEKFALDTECVGGSLNKNADCHLSIAQASSATITGLSHLEGEEVVVWANGKDLGSYTVAAGSITVSETVTTAIVGLGGVSFSYDSSTPAASVTVGTKYNGYPAEMFASGPGGKLQYIGAVTIAAGVATLPQGRTAQKIVVFLGFKGIFCSSKLAYGAQLGTALTQAKRIEKIGLILVDTHNQGLQYGQDIGNLEPMLEVIGAVETPADTVWRDFDQPMVGLPGSWDTDARLHLVAAAPRPAAVAGVVVSVQTNEK